MTKADLAGAMAANAGISKVAAEKALSTFLKEVTNALRKGDRVSLVGFGSFEVARRAARTGRNPQTGARITIQASKVPKFRPGKALKDAVK